MLLKAPQHLENYIGGEWIVNSMDGTLMNFDPSIGEVYGHLPNTGKESVDTAVEIAKQAFSKWKNTPVSERAAILWRIAEMIDTHAEELAMAECIDNGKPLSLCKKTDIPRAAANFRYFAQAITQFNNESFKSEPQVFHYTTQDPLGVVAAISPWNLPLYLFTWKIAPALAAGNTVVAKPSEITPVTAYLLSKIVHMAGLPAGVLNIVHGEGMVTGEALIQNPDIKAVSFTGSTRAGKRIAQLIAPTFKKLSLEMGGKNPFIIFDDADWEHTLHMAVRAAFTNQGQICLCASRFIIQSGIYQRFKTDFIERVKALVTGDPLSPNTDQGALVSAAHYEKVLNAIERAISEGGTVLTGGRPFTPAGRCERGWFVEPTVIENLAMDTATNQEEIFGPVVTLHNFDTIEEAIALANQSDYGLAACVFTTNISTAHTVAQSVDAGMIWVNTWMYRDLRTPFGGMKNSGIGREGGMEALHFFTEKKNITIKH